MKKKGLSSRVDRQRNPTHGAAMATGTGYTACAARNGARPPHLRLVRRDDARDGRVCGGGGGKIAKALAQLRGALPPRGQLVLHRRAADGNDALGAVLLQ